MRLQLRKPSQSLSKAYARHPVLQAQVDVFRRALAKLFDQINETESDEYQQHRVADFFREAYPINPFRIDSDQWIDLILEPGSSDPENTGQLGGIAVVETRKVFAGEMMTPLKNNVKPLHELILYYFETADGEPGRAISQLVITDVYNWFIFDERDFRRFFYDNPRLKKLYQIRQQQKKNDTYFFAETARILRELDAEIPVTYLNLREVSEALTLPPSQGNQLLIPVIKLFSPEQLVARSFTRAADTTSQRFYDELLHIIGLREVQKNKHLTLLDRLPERERLAGSLLENTIEQLQRQQILATLDAPADYGSLESEQLVAIAVDLCISWLTRLLFCKLIERQQLERHRIQSFLSPASIRDFRALNELLSDVIPVREEHRSEVTSGRFGRVPYWQCPLFEDTILEKQLPIGVLDSARTLPLHEQTIIDRQDEKQAKNDLGTLDYLLAFLDAYDFLEESPVVIPPNAKPRMSVSGLGTVLDKIMAYRRGVSVVPSRAISLLVRDGLHRAVMAKFTSPNELAEPPKKVQDIDELKHYLSHFHEPRALMQFNAVVNSLRLVDPAAGSGRFLTAALNELLALKADLGILIDQDGQRIQHIDVSVFNTELLIANSYGDPVLFATGDERPFSGGAAAESQRIQDVIFRETKTVVENCLFGVDGQLSAVRISQFRLLTELLKTAPAGWLPVVNMNIRQGNALVSRFALNFQPDRLKSPNREKFLADFSQYKTACRAYKQQPDKAEKEQIQSHIQSFYEFSGQIALADQKEFAEIRRLEARLAQAALPFGTDHQDDRLQKMINQLAAKKDLWADKERLFRGAFDWRFAFPEVLDEADAYTGFDVVTGDPSGSRFSDLTRAKSYFQQAFPHTYTSKAEPYGLFVELGLNLLRPNGYLVYWLPKKWMQAASAGKLRNWLQTRAVEQVTDFSGLSALDESESWQTGVTIRNAESDGSYRTVRLETFSLPDLGPGHFGKERRTLETPVAETIRSIGQSALDT